MGYMTCMEREFGAGKYAAMWVFGIAFGYIEASVVIYLRKVFGLEAGDLFPVAAALAEPDSVLLSIEVRREAATFLIMLVPALFAGRRTVHRILSFILIFGVWDLSYYGFLQVNLGWPTSLFTYDILFLFPTLWVSPVLCPLLISSTMVLYASLLLLLANRRGLRMPSLLHWGFLLVGGGLMLFAFTGDAEYYLRGGLPPQFDWTTFFAGYGVGAAVALQYLYQTLHQAKTRFY